MLDPAPPEDVLAAARTVSYRAMTLAYLELATPRFTEFDAHYFPGADVRITRLSEPRNYSLAEEPRDTTVLCAEIPCAVGDDVWEASPADLGRLVLDDLARSGIAPAAPLLDVRAERLPQAYPIYPAGYETALDPLDRHVAARPRLLSYGRQGLFAHDNTHHALAMAYAAADCLRDGRFDDARWAEHRREFATHVVED
jgi:protoporphyrinogen oxidase